MTFDAETRAGIARAVLCWCATVDGFFDVFKRLVRSGTRGTTDQCAAKS